mmetsp:Transcript_20719/g.58114  ORF Transcript_20719/g.58114 Transcript_20719/m.58114 type:complete len:322 (-) Transcript_20719:90-1055(-)
MLNRPGSPPGPSPAVFALLSTMDPPPATWANLHWFCTYSMATSTAICFSFFRSFAIAFVFQYQTIPATPETIATHVAFAVHHILRFVEATSQSQCPASPLCAQLFVPVARAGSWRADPTTSCPASAATPVGGSWLVDAITWRATAMLIADPRTRPAVHAARLRGAGPRRAAWLPARARGGPGSFAGGGARLQEGASGTSSSGSPSARGLASQMAPSPSSPEQLHPSAQHSSPSSMTRLWLAPAPTAATRSGTSTWLGWRRLHQMVLSPSCPWLLWPHAQHSPLSRTAKLWAGPAATETAWPARGTLTGMLWSAVVPSPSCP